MRAKTLLSTLLLGAVALPAVAQAQPGQDRREARQDLRQDQRDARRDYNRDVDRAVTDYRRDRVQTPGDPRADRRELQRDLADARQDYRRDVTDAQRDYRRDVRGDWRDGRRDNNWRGNDNWNGNGRNDWRGGDRGRIDGWRGRDGWNTGWRNDRRYDWQGWRGSNRGIYTLPRYYGPRGYDYRRWAPGYRINPGFYGRNYWISDPWAYRLPPAYGSYRWVRYYDDVLLVDVTSGLIRDALYSFFYSR